MWTKIKHNIKRWFNYRYLRFKVRLNQRVDTKHTLSKIQLKTAQITFSLMSDGDAELLSNPNDDKSYIKKTDDNGNVLIFITITKSGNAGYIINVIGRDLPEIKGSYHYDIWFDDYWGRKILDRFYKVLSRRRNKMEDEIRKGDEESLETIYKHVQKIIKQDEHTGRQKTKSRNSNIR